MKITRSVRQNNPLSGRRYRILHIAMLPITLIHKDLHQQIMHRAIILNRNKGLNLSRNKGRSQPNNKDHKLNRNNNSDLNHNSSNSNDHNRNNNNSNDRNSNSNSLEALICGRRLLPGCP